jgi:biotin carboxyl carrier protein
MVTPEQDLLRVHLTPQGGSGWIAEIGAPQILRPVRVVVRDSTAPEVALEVDGHLVRAVALEAERQEWWVHVADTTYLLGWRSPLREPEARVGAAGSLAAPLPGTLVAVLVAPGQRIGAGETLVLLHAMKMEHAITAPYAGTVTAVHFASGDTVPAGAIVLDMRPDTAP